MLNAVLFLLIGLEVVAIAGDFRFLATGAVAILVVLAARAASVGFASLALARFAPMVRGAFSILVWGGLRGGISVALALSLPAGTIREEILTVTYVVVMFSVVVQGATVGRTARRLFSKDPLSPRGSCDGPLAVGHSPRRLPRWRGVPAHPRRSKTSRPGSSIGRWSWPTSGAGPG